MRLINNDLARKIIADRETANKRKRKANNKLDHNTDDLENSMLIEESVAVGNESMIERPSKKRKNMVNPKKRPLEDGSVIVPAKRPRGRPRKIAA